MCKTCRALPVPAIAPNDILRFVRTAMGPRVFLIRIPPDGGYDLPLRHLEVRFDSAQAFHSYTGFEWGYGGSGPAELARWLAAGMTKWLGQDVCAYTQKIKWEFVARIPYAGGDFPAKALYDLL